MATSANEFSLLSFNLWNNYVDTEKRSQLFCRLVEQLKPDIICLQELTLAASAIVHPMLCRMRYFASAKMTNSKLKHFDTAIYVLQDTRTPSDKSIYLCSESELIFDSTKMQRGIKQINILINGIHNIVVATSHFESVFSKMADIKHLQYQQAYYLLKPYMEKNANIRGVIFAADFNIGNTEDDEIFNKVYINREGGGADCVMKDTWITTGSNPRHEITYNNQTNPYNKEAKYHTRIDRVVYSENGGLKCTSHLVIGGFQEPDGTKHAISDHYGVFCKFTITLPGTSTS